jgi:hypothetical protein
LWSDPALKENFVCDPVPNPREDGLIKKKGLNGSTSVRDEVFDDFRRRKFVQDIRAKVCERFFMKWIVL